MKYPFSVDQMKVEDHLFWVVESKQLKGCVAQGETIEDALNEMEINEAEWLDAARELGIPIPKVQIEEPMIYSGKFTVRLSPKVHEESTRMAKSEGISLNQYINDAIVNYNADNRNAKDLRDILAKLDELKAFLPRETVLKQQFKAQQQYSTKADQYSYKMYS